MRLEAACQLPIAFPNPVEAAKFSGDGQLQLLQQCAQMLQQATSKGGKNGGTSLGHACHFMSFHVINHFMSFRVINHFMSFHVISCHFMSFDVI